MSILTTEQKRVYLTEDSSRCPFCRSNNIAGDSIEIEGGTASQRCACDDCGETWGDGYTLTDVFTQEEIDGMMINIASKVELDTILVALRLLQQKPMEELSPDLQDMLAEHGDPLSPEEIGRLCQRLNK